MLKNLTVEEYLKWDAATFKARGLSRPATETEAYVVLCARDDDRLQDCRDWHDRRKKVNVCVKCGYRGLTWSDAKRSYARMMASGVDEAVVKASLSPMCGGKCTTTVLKGMGLRSPARPRFAGGSYARRAAGFT
jgi:hypothetical protein